ncbi:MAG: hypothetical protein J5I93_18125 [Pirellulaceae bacterium]|nr:hypothetical protein [Pirellulaceae bacterium]
MDELRINLMDHDRTLHTVADTALGLAMVAALSAEPETVGEMPLALARYVQPVPADLLDDWQPGLCEEPWDEGLLIIDLAARMLVYEPEELEILSRGQIALQLHGGLTDTWLPFSLPFDWLVRTRDAQWREVAERRRAERGSRPRLDAREVLYGKVCSHVAEACLAADDTSDETVRAIHAEWLLTPREDLAGRSPRELLLEHREEIDSDLQRQADMWTRLGEAPPGLERQATAYRFAGFGTHENVLYYQLVRHLLSEGLFEARRRRQRTLPELTRRLERRKREWLQTPQEELSFLSPADVIDRERRRLPMLANHDHILDDDCPICQMMAEDPTPSFWFLDGCNMDDEYAFSFCASKDEWEAEQARWREWSDARSASSRGDSSPDHPLDAQDDDPLAPSGRVWRSSYFNPDFLDTVSPKIGAQVLLFDLGAKLGELGEDLQSDDHERQLARSLMTHFANLRSALADGSRWQLDVVRRQFENALAQIGAGRSDLHAKTRDFLRQLDVLLETSSRFLPDAAATRDG